MDEKFNGPLFFKFWGYSSSLFDLRSAVGQSVFISGCFLSERKAKLHQINGCVQRHWFSTPDQGSSQRKYNAGHWRSYYSHRSVAFSSQRGCSYFLYIDNVTLLFQISDLCSKVLPAGISVLNLISNWRTKWWWLWEARWRPRRSAGLWNSACRRISPSG